MRVIELTQGKVAQVDDGDYLALSAHKWHACRGKKTWYARRNVPLAGGGYTSIRMHQQVMGGLGFDHEDGDGLNNQRDNLRPASSSQNSMNRSKPIRAKACTSQYKGVTKVRGRWRVQITSVDKATAHGGYFSTEIEAAQRYDELAVQHYGEFAKLNFPKETLCKTA